MTRRDFIGMGLSAAALLKAQAFPTRSIMGGRQQFLRTDAEWQNPYIMDGLVAMWDIMYGIDGGIWKDVVNGREMDISSCIVRDSVFIPRNEILRGVCDALTYESTVEIVMACTAQKQSLDRFKGGCHVLRQSDWSPNNTRFYFTSWREVGRAKWLSTSSRQSIREISSICLRSGDAVRYNGIDIAGVLADPTYAVSTSGEFEFNAASDSSNTGIYLYSFRVYEGFISEEDANYNFAIDQARFDL